MTCNCLSALRHQLREQFTLLAPAGHRCPIFRHRNLYYMSIKKTGQSMRTIWLDYQLILPRSVITDEPYTGIGCLVGSDRRKTTRVTRRLECVSAAAAALETMPTMSCVVPHHWCHCLNRFCCYFCNCGDAKVARYTWRPLLGTSLQIATSPITAGRLW